MLTPMVTNLRQLRDSESNLVDPSTYQNLIGLLMYSVNTYPNIFFVMNTMSQFYVEPRRDHQIAVKHILRYLCGTIDFSLRYVSNCDIQLQGYTNVDWASSVEDKKST